MTDNARKQVIKLLWEKQFEDSPWQGKFHLINYDSLARDYGKLADDIIGAVMAEYVRLSTPAASATNSAPAAECDCSASSPQHNAEPEPARARTGIPCELPMPKYEFQKPSHGTGQADAAPHGDTAGVD